MLLPDSSDKTLSIGSCHGQQEASFHLLELLVVAHYAGEAAVVDLRNRGVQLGLDGDPVLNHLLPFVLSNLVLTRFDHECL